MVNLNTVSYLFIVIAAICTLTSVITQLTKEMGILSRIPTAVQVTVISILLTVVSFMAYASYKTLIIKWYYIFAAVIAGILIAYITMFGWDNLIVKFKAFYKKTQDIKKEEQ